MDVFVAVTIIGAVGAGAYVYLSKHLALTAKAVAETKLVEAEIRTEEHRTLELAEDRVQRIGLSAAGYAQRLAKKIEAAL